MEFDGHRSRYLAVVFRCYRYGGLDEFDELEDLSNFIVHNVIDDLEYARNLFLDIDLKLAIGKR